MDSPWFTKNEAAEYLRCSPATIARWVREGRLMQFNVHGTQAVRFRREDLDALLVTPAA